MEPKPPRARAERVAAGRQAVEQMRIELGLPADAGADAVLARAAAEMVFVHRGAPGGRQRRRRSLGPPPQWLLDLAARDGDK